MQQARAPAIFEDIERKGETKTKTMKKIILRLENF